MSLPIATREKDAMSNQATRNNGLDLLKVLMMFCIVLFHFHDHGAVRITSDLPLTLNWCVLAGASIFGAIGNCVFMFITGYFLCDKPFRVRRLTLLWGQVFFYSVLCRIITVSTGIDTLNIGTLVKTIFPVIYERYWYFSAYVVVLIASPLLNLVIRQLSRKKHFWLCIVFLVLFSVIPTFAKGSWLGGQIGNENFLKIFITLYIVAAYIRFYGISIINKHQTYLFISLGMMSAEIVSIFMLRFASRLLNYDFYLFYFTWGMDKIHIIIASIAIFMWFKGLNLRNNKILTSISAATFSIYLLHVGSWKYLFGVLFNNGTTYYTQGGVMALQMLCCAVFVCTVSFIVDKIRVRVFEAYYIRVLDKLGWGKQIDKLFHN